MEKAKNIAIFSILALYMLSLISIMIITINKRPDTPATKASGKYKLPKITPENAIAVIDISGPIRMSQRQRMFLSYDSGSIIKRIQTFGERPEVKAIVLRINSPGGSVAATQEIYSEIINQRTKNKKVIVASIGDVGASGGYYIASACDKIVANPGSITGSIGVILELGNVKELFKKIGVKVETVKSGRFKDSGSPFRDLGIEERKILQDLVSDAYSQFINSIVEGRKMPKEKVLKLADGRIYTGAQALGLGLIDKLGNEKTAVDLATELAKITGKVKVIDEYEPWEQIISLFGQTNSITPVEELLAKSKFRLEYILE